MGKRIFILMQRAHLFKVYRSVAMLCSLSLCCVPLLFAGIADEEKDKLPEGLWKVEQITVEKRIDKNVQTNTYKSVLDVQSHIPCPQEWQVNAKRIILRYPGGIEDSVDNSLEDNQLTIYSYDGVKQIYRFSNSGGKMSLSITHAFSTVLPTRQIEKVTETWVITLKKE